MTPKSVLLSFIALNSLVGASSPGGDTSANAAPTEDSCAASEANLPCRADQMGVAEQLMRRMAAEMEASAPDDASVRLKARNAKALAEMCRAGKPELRYLPLPEMAIDYLSLPGHKLAAAEVLPLLLEAGVNPNGAEDDGTPLFAAVERGNLEAFRILRAAGARTDVQNDRGRALSVAMAAHHAAEMLAELPDAGLKSVRLKGGYTLLHAAVSDPNPGDCCCGRELPKVEAVLATCRFLIEKGVDVNAAADNGETALMRVIYGFDDVARLLLEAGADANARDKEGNTALDRALQSGDVNRCRLLWAAGGKLANGSPTHLAVLLGDVDELRRLLPGRSAEDLAQLLDVALMNRQWQVCRLLVYRLACTDESWRTWKYLRDYREEGAMPEDIRASVMALTPLPNRLLYAVDIGDEALCRECLNAGAEPDDQLLSYAVMVNKPAIIRALAEAGVDVNCPDEGGWTPLFWAAQRGYLECVRELLRAGANPNGAEAPEAERRYPLLIALQYGATDCVRALLDAGAGPDLNSPRVLMLLGARCANPDTLRLLSDRGLSLRGNRRVLQEHVTARPDFGYARAEYCDVLQEAGAQLDDWSLLHLEVRLNRPEKVRALIAAGADVNARDAEGNTPLMCAALLGNEEMIRILLEAGAQTDLTNKEGDIALQAPVAKVDECDPSRVRDASHLLELLALKDTCGPQAAVVLHRAVMEADLPLLQRLLSAGVSPNLCVADGNTPLHTAAKLHYYNSRPLVLRLLLAYGADPQAKNADGRTPSQRAAKNEMLRPAVCELFRQWAAAEPTPTGSAVMIAPDAELPHADSFISRVYEKAMQVRRVEDTREGLDAVHHYRLWRAGKEQNAYPLLAALLSLSQMEIPAEAVQELIAAGADVNRLWCGSSPLHCAVGRPEIVKLLLAAGANVEVVGEDEGTPLYEAAAAGDVESCRLLLDAGAQMNRRYEGVTAFETAREWGRYDVCRLLLERGCEAAISPLEQAVMCRDADAVKRLLAAGGDAEETTKFGRSLLEAAAMDGCLAVCRELLAAGATPHAQEGKACIPLSIAAAYGHADVCRALVEAGADVNAADALGDTPLYEAARVGHAATCRLLIALGAQVNAANREGSTPLLAAIFAGRAEVCRALMEAGAEVDVKSLVDDVFATVSPEVMRALLVGGLSPDARAEEDAPPLLLHFILQGNAEVCRVLIEGGADVNVNADGSTPLLLAAAQDLPNVCLALLEAGARAEVSRDGSGSPLDRAILFGRKELAAKLLNAGIKPAGLLPLHLAAALGRAAEVKQLLADGADVNAPAKLAGLTPLQFAVLSGDMDTFHALLAAGADVHAAHNTRIALHTAAQMGRDEMVRELLAAGADPNARNLLGCTPLCLAVDWGHYEVCEALLAAGASVSIPAHEGHAESSLSEFAAERGYTALHQLLTNPPTPKP